MRQFPSRFLLTLALSISTRVNAQSCCSGAARMAFVGQQNSVNYIYLMDVDASSVGLNPIRLTNDSEAENYPSWSPDGMRLVYQRDFNGSAIYVINADGTGEQRLSPTPGFDVTPSWSADGTKIIYARLYEASPANEPPPMTDVRVMKEAGDTNWSSDGKKIAFEYDINGMKQSSPAAYAEVWTMNPDGSGETSPGVQCSDVGCPPRWQPTTCRKHGSRVWD